MSLIEFEEKSSRAKTWLFNPSRLLRLMLGVLFILFIALVALERGLLDWSVLGRFKLGMQSADWVPTIGIYFAATGWITSAIVTMRNSVKQHTINTLLQTRLSTTYMDRVSAVNLLLANYWPSTKAPASVITATRQGQADVDYILNYLEFLAVAIRHGDLHEGVMKDTMRGIVVRFTIITQEYIQGTRTAVNPRTFSNLLWLYNRWKD